MITRQAVQNHITAAERLLTRLEALLKSTKKINVPGPSEVLKLQDTLAGCAGNIKPALRWAENVLDEARTADDEGTPGAGEIKALAKKLKKIHLKTKQVFEQLQQISTDLSARYDAQHYQPGPTTQEAGSGHSDRRAGGLVRR